jgi:hypothetical protein
MKSVNFKNINMNKKTNKQRQSETTVIKKQDDKVITTIKTRYVDMATGLVYTSWLEIASIDRK